MSDETQPAVGGQVERRVSRQCYALPELTDDEKKAAWRYAVNDGVYGKNVNVGAGGFDPMDLYVVTGTYEATCKALQLAKMLIGLEAPTGWQMVPKEPTPEMKQAGWGGAFGRTDKYRAMIAVAPAMTPNANVTGLAPEGD